jgi:hypothetical protein
MQLKSRVSPWIYAILFAVLPLFAEPEANISEEEALRIGVDAYIYGYPLVTMDMTQKVMTNVTSPNAMRAPLGQFANARVYPNATFKDVTAPNADTLYSSAWLDLSKEPYVLHVPNENRRYYLMPMLSGWTNVFSVPGTRTTGTLAADYIITGPDLTKKELLPYGLTQIKSPTNLVWIIGRTYSTGTQQDYEIVHKLQDSYSLTPLSQYRKLYTPPEGIVNPNIDMNTPVRDQVNQMDSDTFFKLLASLMKDNPPAAEDGPMIAEMAKIGIVPGKEFDPTALDPKIAHALEQAPKLALEKIQAHEKNLGKLENGWLIILRAGEYGTDYLQRALVTFVGLGANRPEDAIYPIAQVDGEGNPLNGQNHYVLHFPKDKIPPIKAFWSLTMYNDQYFFIENPLKRYSISPRNHLIYNRDGSLDIYIQHDSPGVEKESNWLPAPADGFILMLRLYWPEAAILNGTWAPPPIQKKNKN